jgi:hypothetical protein
MVNGKHYPLWSQFVDRKDEWIGGELVDLGDGMDKILGIMQEPMRTTITGITLDPNGSDSAFFSIVGKDFTCGFDVHHGGIPNEQEGDGWLVFSGYGGARFMARRASD